MPRRQKSAYISVSIWRISPLKYENYPFHSLSACIAKIYSRMHICFVKSKLPFLPSARNVSSKCPILSWKVLPSKWFREKFGSLLSFSKHFLISLVANCLAVGCAWVPSKKENSSAKFSKTCETVTSASPNFVFDKTLSATDFWAGCGLVPTKFDLTIVALAPRYPLMAPLNWLN